MNNLIRWFQQPEHGPLIHAAAALLAALLSAGVGYVSDPSDPFKLGAPTLGLVGLLGQTLVSWLRQVGKVTVRAYEIRPNSDMVTVPTAGREPPVRQPATEPDPPAE